MSAINFSNAAVSTATAIINAGEPIIEKAVQRVGTYNEITSDAIAKNTTRNIKEMTDQPIVDLFGQVGLVKPPGIDISV